MIDDKDIYKFTPSEDIIIKPKESFEIRVHGVEGISLRVHKPTITHEELRMKLFEFYQTLMSAL